MAIAVLAGCKKPVPVEPEETLADKVAGEWLYTDKDLDIEVYLSFAKEGTFEIYQKITQGSFRLYRGTWKAESRTIDGNALDILSGKYNDGTGWGAEYQIIFPEDMEKSMMLAAMDKVGYARYTYTRAEIPDNVKENCVVMVKSPYAY